MLKLVAFFPHEESLTRPGMPEDVDERSVSIEEGPVAAPEAGTEGAEAEVRAESHQPSMGAW